jgi:hypothetical protein
MVHTNVAALQTYHNFGGMILRPPGREGGVTLPGDERLHQAIAQRGEKMLPFYRSMIVWKDLYPVWGGSFDWAYGALGMVCFSNEMWSNRNLDRSTNSPSVEDSAEFMRHLLLNEGVVPWKKNNHPDYGEIEIGGTAKEWGRVPPSFLLEEECHRNMAFTLYHAGQMPLLAISDVRVEPIREGLASVWVEISNSRLIPTHTEQDVQNKIHAPDVVSLTGPGVRVLSAGMAGNRFLKQTTPVKRRPARVEIPTIPGMGAVKVQFIVAGKGDFTVQVDSPKFPLLKATGELP